MISISISLQMKPLKSLIIWHFYAATYALIFNILFLFVPEKFLYELVDGPARDVLGNSWDDAYMSILLISSLAINAILIYSVALTIMIFRKKRPSTRLEK